MSNQHKRNCELSAMGWSATIPPVCTCDMENKEQNKKWIIGDDGDREWLCDHGVGHGNNVHTCDGCCSEETKLPECNLHKNIEYGMCTCGWKKLPELNCPKCHSSQHSSESCITREEFKGTEEEFNKKYNVHYPQKEEPKNESYEDIKELEPILEHFDSRNNNKETFGYLEFQRERKQLKQFISQEISKAYEEGYDKGFECQLQTGEISFWLAKAKQEVISLCLEKIEGMKKIPDENWGLCEDDTAYNQALQDVSDKIKGI